MKKFLKEFKEFAMKGSVLDLAVGMMIGSAFSSIVSSLVNDILMPLVSTLLQVEDFSGLKILLVDKGDVATNVYLNYGAFIQNIIDFLIIALCIFMIVKSINHMKDRFNKQEKEEPSAPAKSDELKALEEIITILKEKK